MFGEFLTETLFFGLDDARNRFAEWVADYNNEPGLLLLKYQTPAAFAASIAATGDLLRNPDRLRRSPVVHLAVVLDPLRPIVTVVDHDGGGTLHKALQDVIARHGKRKILNIDQISQVRGAALTAVLADHGISFSLYGTGA